MSPIDSGTVRPAKAEHRPITAKKPERERMYAKRKFNPGSSGAARTARAGAPHRAPDGFFPSAALAHRDSRNHDLVAVFLLAAGVSIALMVTLLGFSSHYWLKPAIQLGAKGEFNYKVSVDGPTSKDQFLARVSAAEKREMAASVHYVTEVISLRATKLSRAEAHRLANYIVFESKRANFDPIFVAAVIKSESTFNKHAVSNVGALGLMQILPDTGKYISKKSEIDWLGKKKLNDPSYNIRLGIAYLKYLEEYFPNNKEHVLVAYNWGPGNLLSALKKRSRLPEGPQNYARTILRDHSKWQREYIERAEEFRFLDLESALG